MIFKASLVNMPPLFSYFKGDEVQKMLLRTLSKYGFCIEILILKRILMKNKVAAKTKLRKHGETESYFKKFCYFCIAKLSVM